MSARTGTRGLQPREPASRRDVRLRPESRDSIRKQLRPPTSAHVVLGHHRVWTRGRVTGGLGTDTPPFRGAATPLQLASSSHGLSTDARDGVTALRSGDGGVGHGAAACEGRGVRLRPSVSPAGLAGRWEGPPRAGAAKRPSACGSPCPSRRHQALRSQRPPPAPWPSSGDELLAQP